MECPRCGGKMLGGVCEDCGFPITSVKMIVWKTKMVAITPPIVQNEIIE